MITKADTKSHCERSR